MLRKIRIILALIFLTGVTLLFVDFTGTAHRWLGWMAKVQFLPAVMAINVVVIAALLLLTLLMGRVYCSVICPLGVTQDIISWLNGRRKGRKRRFDYKPAKRWLRYGVLAIFVVSMLAGVSAIVSLLAPYSAYGRIAQSLLAPIYLWINNLLAWMAERMDSYAFYSVDVWVRSLPVMIVAIATLAVVGILAWRHGRLYCNSICPVGTLLGVISRYSMLKPVFDTDKCNGCGACARGCKSSCIDSRSHAIDYSRCVACMDCVDQCRQGAISYKVAWRRRRLDSEAGEKSSATVDTSRRGFLATGAVVATGLMLQAREKRVDGGLAVILDREKPKRNCPVLPPGAGSATNLNRRCTACQLCVASCPNQVLVPSSELSTLGQPTMSYERGYCRPGCVKCSHACPTGAIHPITPAQKASTQIGHAVWIKNNCVIFTEDVRCGNCARHCPCGAITMRPSVAGDPASKYRPMVDTERCIGCGACEHVCPARPFAAIYVEGQQTQRDI